MGVTGLISFSDATTYLFVHLMFTYLFALFALYFVYQNYRRFIRPRQLFSLELVHSIPARTVQIEILVTDLPNYLQGDRPLAEYLGLAVIVRHEVPSLE